MSKRGSSTATELTLQQRAIARGFDLFESALRDPSVLDEIPDGVTLVLLPLDDPEGTAHSVQLGLEALDRGEDVLFKHVRDKDSA